MPPLDPCCFCSSFWRISSSRSLIYVKILRFVSLLIPGLSFNANDTVASETPNSFAISFAFKRIFLHSFFWPVGARGTGLVAFCYAKKPLTPSLWLPSPAPTTTAQLQKSFHHVHFLLSIFFHHARAQSHAPLQVQVRLRLMHGFLIYLLGRMAQILFL